MINSSGFYYANEYSGNKGIVKIQTSGGFITESFLGSVYNQTHKAKNSIKSSLLDSDSEPIVIPMALLFDENLDESTIRGVKKWLNQDDFKELVFEDNPDKVYFAKTDGEIILSYNTISSGYVEFNFITNSANTFSRVIEIEGESTSSLEYESFLVHNEGDLTIYPKMKIVFDQSEATDLEIYNDTTGEFFFLENNLVNETVIIWNEYEELETSSNLRYGYDDHNGQFISLAEGANEMRIKGNVNYTIEYQNVYL